MLLAYMLWKQEGLPCQMQVQSCSEMYRSLFLWGVMFKRLHLQSTSSHFFLNLGIFETYIVFT